MASLDLTAQLAQVKNTTEKTGQDVTQLKNDVAKMRGYYTFSSLFYVEIFAPNFQETCKKVQDQTLLSQRNYISRVV